MKRFALLLLSACAPAPEATDASFVLRVGTHGDLAPMEPTVGGTTTRNMVELVYGRPLSAYFSSISAGGQTVKLRLQPGHRSSASALAKDFTHPQLVAASAVGDDIVVVLRTNDAAAALMLDEYGFAHGPYSLIESKAGRLVLDAKQEGDGPARIDVSAVATAEEEWRRFIAGDFDLLPSVLPGSIRYLARIPSVRIVHLKFPQTAALWFRVAGGAMENVDVRRAVARAVRRRPLAANVTGDADAAQQAEEDVGLAKAGLSGAGYSVAAPLRLRMLVHEAQSDLVRAALVLQQQLASVGITLDVSSLELPDMLNRIVAGDFDLVLFYGDNSPRSWGKLSALSGYVAQDFTAAVASGDEKVARQILERDVPLTPLFILDEAAAIHRRFCNVHPAYVFDYSWLAEVHLCGPGEEN